MQYTHYGRKCYEQTYKGHSALERHVGCVYDTYLTPLRPAATIFWKMSSQSSRTGRRKVWNSPELIACSQRGQNQSTSSDSLKEDPLVVDPQGIVVPLDDVGVPGGLARRIECA